MAVRPMTSGPRDDGDPLVGTLTSIVGTDHVVTDGDRRASYEVDWMGRRAGPSRLVVLPASAGEVARVLQACDRAGAAVVPQGGNTGLVGGGVPRHGEVVLSTTRMAAVGPVDPMAAQVAAGAGATLASVAEAAARAGFEVPLDLASRDSATVGGMVATDAGGTRVLRHGSTRAHLAGVEAVLADGSVLRRMAGLTKDNAGYDLPGLVCGSEGTLAVVTEVLLRLVPSPGARVSAVVGVADLASAQALIAAARATLPGLEAAEVVFADGVALVEDLLGVAGPLRSRPPCQLLVDVVSPDEGEAALVERLARVVAAHDPHADTAVAAGPTERRRLWEVRERHPELVGLLGRPHKLDVSLPARALAPFEADVRAALAAAVPGAVPVLFGHAGDGGMHVNVATPGDVGDLVAETVLPLVARHGGSVSAEHGIGTDKVRWLELTRSGAEIAAMRRIKAALDPGGILNPGVLLG